MADELTPEAKAEIAEAIRIVREDRFEKFIRGRFPATDPKNEPPTPPVNDPPKDPKNEPPTPPKNEPPAPPEPTPEPPRKKGGIWWSDPGDDE